MAFLISRAVVAAPLTTTALTTMVAGISFVMLCLLITSILLLVRSIKIQRRLLADRGETGISFARIQEEADRKSTTRPCAIWRRNTALPFDMTSGLEGMPLVKISRPTESRTDPSRYTPAMHTDAMERDGHLWWPFSNRHPRDQSVSMQKTTVSRLSTVLKSPESSLLLPNLNGSHMHVGAQSLTFPSEYSSRQSSCQSLLQHHAAFRSENQDTNSPEPATQESVKTNKLLSRAQSTIEVPVTQMTQPRLTSRSGDLCSPTFKTTPDVDVPPLPLGAGRINNGTGSDIPLEQTPSKLSIPDLGLSSTTVVGSHLIPVPPLPKKSPRMKNIKSNAKTSTFAAGRTIRDTLDLCTKVSNGRYPNEPNTGFMSEPALKTQDMQGGNKGKIIKEWSRLPGRWDKHNQSP